MPQETAGRTSILRFGVYEVDLRSGELRRSGVRVSLQEQPFRVLVRLLAAPGELVTREALRQELWAGDTFVDFEHGLNAAIRRLRDALGDSADTPRFVETLPKRGYRFVAPVQAVQPPAAVVHARWRGPAAWTLAAVAGLLAAVAIMWRSEDPRPAAPVDTIVLADIENQTNDAVLTGTIRQALAIKLGESRVVSVLSNDRVQDMLALMVKARDEPLKPALAREVCRRAGAKATLGGSVASLGSAYVVSLEADECSTGEPLARDQAQAWRKEDVLAVLDAMSTRMRRRLGESLASIGDANTPLERATTPSFEALRAFTDGESRFATGEQLEAIPFYNRAIALDPAFAMAHAKLAIVEFNTSIPGGAAELARAYALRERLSRREQFYVTAHYTRLALGDLEGSRPIYEIWKAAYPRDEVPYTSLGFVSLRQGAYDRAVTEFEGAVRVAPRPFNYSNLFSVYLAAGRTADAHRMLGTWEAESRQPIHYARFLMAFHRRDLRAVEEEGAQISNDEESVLNADAERARAEAFFGRMTRARPLFASAADPSGRRPGSTAASSPMEAAVWEAEIGNCGDARALLRRQPAQPQAAPLAAVALAACGDAAAAAHAAQRLDRRAFPPADADLAGAVLDARIALAQRQFTVVIERLARFRPTMLRGSLDAARNEFHGLAAAYLRGRAYLALGRPADAEQEFAAIVAHPGIAAFAAYHAVAPLYLARACAMAGDRARSRAAYADFLRLWAHADDDIPLLRAAREEYARVDRAPAR